MQKGSLAAFFIAASAAVSIDGRTKWQQHSFVEISPVLAFPNKKNSLIYRYSVNRLSLASVTAIGSCESSSFT